MPFLVAAMVLVGVIATVNLLLSYGIIRRLREHEAKLAGFADQASEVLTLAVGELPAAFEPVVSTAGDTISRKSLKGANIAFFSPDCSACKEESPKFVERARRLQRENVLVVAVGSQEETADLVSKFESVACVVVEPDRGPVQQAFKVEGFPALAVLDDEGRVARKAFTVQAISGV